MRSRDWIKNEPAGWRGTGSAAGSESLTPLNNYFFVARRLVAATLLARDPAAVVSLNRGSFHAAALSWTDGDTT
jgi:hypothetical protein